MATLSTNATMPRCLDRTASFAHWAVSVRVLVGPLLQAKRIEAQIILADAEAQAEQPSQVCNTISNFGSKFIQLISPFAKLIRFIEELVISKQ
jgi:hypothetical protein